MEATTKPRLATNNNAERRRYYRRLSFMIIAVIIIFTLRKNVMLSFEQTLIITTNAVDEPTTLLLTPSSSVKMMMMMKFANDTLSKEMYHNNQYQRHYNYSSSKSLDSKKSKNFPPLDCWDIFHEDRNKPRPAGDPNDGRLHLRYTITDPPFWVALHKKEFDPTRWSVMEYGRYYEAAETEAFVSIIRAHIINDAHQQDDVKQKTNSSQQPLKLATASSVSPLRVIDVGGNIGWFTLAVVAAAMERKHQQHPIVVDVFEPNPRNHRRLCESLFFNEWLHHNHVAVNLYALGVTSTKIATDPTKTGRISVSSSGKGSLRAMERVNLTETVAFPLVSLDLMAQDLGWTDNANNNIAILKVDVEGFEVDVIEGAKHLLKSHTVQNIFFEGNLRKTLEHQKFRRMAKVLVSSGYVAYKILGLKVAIMVATNLTQLTNNYNNPKGNDTSNIVASHSPSYNVDQYIEALKDECETPSKRRKQCNMWWRPASSLRDDGK